MTRTAPALAGLALLAGCTAQPRPAPAVPVVTPPAPPPTTVVPPAETDWRDVPLTPGTWRYAAGAATYGLPGAPVLAMRCDLGARRVVFAVPGAAGSLAVRTSSASRTVSADGALAARDPFLDEIAFSRGRFSITPAGGATLYIPAWAEPARVIEDCRG